MSTTLFKVVWEQRTKQKCECCKRLTNYEHDDVHGWKEQESETTEDRFLAAKWEDDVWGRATSYSDRPATIEVRDVRVVMTHITDWEDAP